MIREAKKTKAEAGGGAIVKARTREQEVWEFNQATQKWEKVKRDCEIIDLLDGGCFDADKFARNAIVEFEAKDSRLSMSGEMLQRLNRMPKNRLDSGDLIQIAQTVLSEKLNPYTDIVIFKQDNEPAAIIIKEAAFLRRADTHPDYRGYKAGWILSAGNGKGRKYIPHGTDIGPTETIIGAWCKVIREGRETPVVECLMEHYKRNAKSWNNTPDTMIVKTARCQAHRQAYPEQLAGLYADAEMPHVVSVESTVQPPKDETPTRPSEQEREALGDALMDAMFPTDGPEQPEGTAGATPADPEPVKPQTPGEDW